MFHSFDVQAAALEAFLKANEQKDEPNRNKGKRWKYWSEQDDTELKYSYNESINEMANKFGRTPKAIKSRIKKLKLDE